VTTDDIINAVLAREGGYVNHASDRGGPTNHGITIGTLAAWRGKPQNADDVRALAVAEARDIYRQKYIIEPGFDAIADDNLKALLVDSAVNHGPKRAIKFLQAALGVKEDGVFGVETKSATEVADGPATFRKALGRRIRFYGAIISRDHTQAVFAAGWANRVAEFLES
jgi:lysozyme family protein